MLLIAALARWRRVDARCRVPLATLRRADALLPTDHGFAMLMRA